jgi:hypothetical protein
MLLFELNFHMRIHLTRITIIISLFITRPPPHKPFEPIEKGEAIKTKTELTSIITTKEIYAEAE